MASIADNSVKIQTTSESNFSTPSWFGEAVVISSYLHKHGILSKITEQVRFARKRFGRYEVIDFLAVLFGYAISGERTLEEFYQRLEPFGKSLQGRLVAKQIAKENNDKIDEVILAEACAGEAHLLLDRFQDSCMGKHLSKGGYFSHPGRH